MVLQSWPGVIIFMAVDNGGNCHFHVFIIGISAKDLLWIATSSRKLFYRIHPK